MENINIDNIETILLNIINETKITNLFTNLLPVHFYTEVKIGLVDLLTTENLISEYSKKTPLKNIDKYFIENLKDRTSTFKANIIWELLFQKNIPLSKECQKITYILNKIDSEYQNRLNDIIQNNDFDKKDYQSNIIQLTNIKNIYIPVNPLSISQSSYWIANPVIDTFYKKYLLIDDIFDKDKIIKNQNYYQSNFFKQEANYNNITRRDILNVSHNFNKFYYSYFRNWIINIGDLDFIYLNLKLPSTDEEFNHYRNIFSNVISPLLDIKLLPLIINLIDTNHRLVYGKNFLTFLDQNYPDIVFIGKNIGQSMDNFYSWKKNIAQKSIPNIWDELIFEDLKIREEALDFLLPKFKNLIKNNFKFDKEIIKKEVENILGGNWNNLTPNEININISSPSTIE